MKKKVFYTERGQALILIVFAAIGLFAFTALAIDSGRVFSDHRHSQNASDTAVLAAALERVKPHTGVNWEDVAKQRAAANGYSTNTETQVDAYLCSDLPQTVNGYKLECKGLPADPTVKSQYVYVHIKSVVHLMFGPIIGWRTITHHTDAVAHAGVPVPTKWFDGFGVTSTHEGCTSPGDSDPIDIVGNSENYVIGSGVMVNASCPGKASFVQNGSSSLDVSTNICVHGTASYDPGDISSSTNPPVQTGCSPINPNKYQLPDDPVCDREGSIEPVPNRPGVWVAQPGNYTDNKPFPDVSGSPKILLTKGIYCFYHGVDLNAQTTITTDWNENGDFDPSVEGVLFYLPGTAGDDEITINGGANVHLEAITSKPWDWFEDQWLNLLIYVKPVPGYDPDIQLNGNSGSTYVGTILAPGAHVILGGGSGSTGGTGTATGEVILDAQIIADTVKFAGGTNFKIYYDDSKNATTYTVPDLSQTE